MVNEQSSGIDIAAIERELTDLWQQAGEDEQHGGVIRSALLNLLVYAPSDTDAGKLDEVMTEITVTHPCRAILMVADRKVLDSYMNAQVTSRCTLPTAGTKQVCCEQVTITAGGSRMDEVPSAVVPLLISDLPVYLWWRAVPRLTDEAVFGHLVDISDRVIIDSAEFDDQQGDLASMAAVLHDTPRWAAFSDLNWARLTAWRALLAGFYDVAEYRPFFNQLNSIVIDYAPPSADASAIPARALLLAGWLASRLGWHLDSATKKADGASAFEFTDGDRKIMLEFTLTQRNVRPGLVAQVTLGSAANQSASLSVRRSADGTRIETAVKIGEEKKAQRVLGYENLSESALVGKELEILGHDRVYEQAVLSAGELIREISGGQ